MISLEITCGRRRRVAYGLYVFVALGGAYVWLGNSGFALVGLWAYSHWPRWQTRRYEWSPAEVDTVWLWGNTLAVRLYGGATFWVFADELSHAEFARVRRRLKSQIEGLL